MKLAGTPPPGPPWGQRLVYDNPELRRRVRPDDSMRDEVAVVLGAGGAFGPDVVRALQLRGAGAVIGADLSLTYPVLDAIYRRVDLSDPGELRRFFEDVRVFAQAHGWRLGPVFDLSTIQTTPTGAPRRGALERGKGALVDLLCEGEGDPRLFMMSTAEVYGAPAGAPYRESHEKAPFNDYGRAKWREEQQAMAGHDRASASGRLRVVALRSWTICMVEADQESGAVIEARNYNDPMVMVAERLARAGARVPVVDPDLLATFHFAEEVAEAAVLLGCAPPDEPTWGRAFNCVGRPAGHGALRDALHEVFPAGSARRPWWGPLAATSLRSGRLPRRAIESLASVLERADALGARDMAARLPFLYRSTHLDSSALSRALEGRLSEPAGADSVEAVRRLATGIREGGPHALNRRRYALY